MKKTVVLGVCGGVAAFKAAQIVSDFRKRDVDVYTIMTKHACEFITPLTLESLSNHPCVYDMFRRENSWEVEHISLAKRADVFLVVPATANFIGKYAYGIADDMLTTTAMATRAPMLIAPAMNTNMWLSAANQANVNVLEQRGVHFVWPDSGRLACGDIGVGKLASVRDIVDATMALLYDQPGKNDLAGKKVVVTAGPTREAIDPVRYITNHSSGKMGYALAAQAKKRGAQVLLLSGPVNLATPRGVTVEDVVTTRDLLDKLLAGTGDADIVIQAAAPADYRPAHPADRKIKKQEGAALRLDMVGNPDCAYALGKTKKPGQVFVGFAAETDDHVENARKKLAKKNLDFIVVNDVRRRDAGFNADTNQVSMIFGDRQIDTDLLPKTEIADRILDEAAALLED